MRMLKWLNILVVAYLAVAPGMNVEVLIHSANLCRFTSPDVATEVPAHHSSTCGHNHGCPSQDDRQEDTDDCPHLCQAVAPANAMPTMQVQAFDEQPCPAVTNIDTLVSISLASRALPADHSRPPPWPASVSTTILLI